MIFPHRAYVGLGANLHDPAAALKAAIDDLAEMAGSCLVRTSALYRSAPVGLASQPDFINAVAELETSLDAEQLLASLLKIEARHGRVRGVRNGPRTLDMDLLLFDASEIHAPQLTVPHPRLHLRAFILVPLDEIAPGLAIPGRGSVAAWLPAVRLQQIERLP